MSRLSRGRRDDTMARDALIRGQGRAILNVVDEEIESTLGVRLEVLQLREGALEVVNVVPVLDLVEAILCLPLVVVPLPGGGDLRLVCPRMATDGEKSVHGARDRHEWLLDLSRRGESGDGGRVIRHV